MFKLILIAVMFILGCSQNSTGPTGINYYSNKVIIRVDTIAMTYNHVWGSYMANIRYDLDNNIIKKDSTLWPKVDSTYELQISQQRIDGMPTFINVFAIIDSIYTWGDTSYCDINSNDVSKFSTVNDYTYLHNVQAIKHDSLINNVRWIKFKYEVKIIDSLSAQITLHYNKIQYVQGQLQ